MSNEEKFKQSLKSLVESKEFVFDEKDWDKAAAYISRKRAGNRAGRMGLLLLAVAGLVGTSLLVLSSGSTGKNEVAQTIQVNATTPDMNREQVITKVSPTGKSDDRGPANAPEANPAEKKSSKSKIKKTPLPVSGSSIAEESTNEKVTQDEQISVTVTRKEKTDDKGENPGSASPQPPVLVAVSGTNDEIKPGEKNEEATTETITPVNEEKETVTQEPEIKQEVAASVQTATQSPAVVEKTVPDSIKAKVPRVILLSCEAGASYQPGWKNEGGARDADGLNPVAGVHYMNPIDDRFTLSFGVQYQRTGHLDAFSHTSKQSRYSFGEESEVTTITPSKLHYLAVPLRLYYKLDDKNMIGGSYSIAYLLDVEANVETYTLKVGKQNNKKSYTTRGYTDGFALFDSQIALFYRRHLYGAFSVHGELFLGLNDVKQNGFFGGDKSQRNSGLRLMLVYGIYSRSK